MLGWEPSAFGIGGIFAGAALVFFAYIGFDVVATTAEEAKNPQRDLPIGIIGSLVICTILYGAVSLVITGMVKYDQIDSSAALATAFTKLGHPGYATLIAAGAVAGLTTVVLTLMIGASRVVFAMSRDHLLPAPLSKVHPKFQTPWVITIIIGVVVMLVAGLTPIGKLEEMVNIGTLTAFILVSIGVIVLRQTRPDLPRSFKVPFVAGAADPVRGDLLLAHPEPVHRDLDPVRDLDGAGLRRLLRCTATRGRAWPPGRRCTRCRTSTTWRSSHGHAEWGAGRPLGLRHRDHPWPGVVSAVGYRTPQPDHPVHYGLPSPWLTVIFSLDDGVESASDRDALPRRRRLPIIAAGLHTRTELRAGSGRDRRASSSRCTRWRRGPCSDCPAAELSATEYDGRQVLDRRANGDPAAADRVPRLVVTRSPCSAST